MRKPKIILDVFFSFLFVIISSSMYGQREIISVEESFTYDYVLKYFINLPALEHFPDYWFLENFKAPNGVNSIEVYPYDDKTTFFKRIPKTIVINGNEIKTDDYVFVHSYSSKHGFLEKTVLYPYRGDKKGRINQSGILYKTYQYHLEKNEILIDVYFPNSEDIPMQYKFDKETGNLLKISKTPEDSISFLYEDGTNKFQKAMLVEAIDKSEKYTISTSETKQKQDSFSFLSGINIYYNKDQSEIPTFSFFRWINNYIGCHFFLNDREFIVDMTKYEKEPVPSERETSINFLFNSSKELTHVNFEEKRVSIPKESSNIIFEENIGTRSIVVVEPPSKTYFFGLIKEKIEPEIDNFSLVKKNKNKWVRYGNIRVDSKNGLATYKAKKIDKIKKRSKNIYKGSFPLIIYK